MSTGTVAHENETGRGLAGEGWEAPSEYHSVELSEKLSEIERCLAYLYKRVEPKPTSCQWAIRHPRLGLSAWVRPDLRTSSVHIAVRDDFKEEEIELWGSTIRLIGDWRHRLRGASGVALVLAQRRPQCPACGKPLRLARRKADGCQFFGCSDFPACRGAVGIVAHDIERSL